MNEGALNGPVVSYGYLESYPGTFTSCEKFNDFIEIRTDNHCTLRVYIYHDFIVRFRFSTQPFFQKDFSYAIDPKFRKQRAKFKLTEDVENLYIETKSLTLKIQKAHLYLQVFDNIGDLLSKDEKGFHWEENAEFGGESVKMSKYVADDEYFFGLGDKTARQNIRQHRFSNWNTDEYGFKSGTDPLYKSINFICSKSTNKSYGLYFDNSFRSNFDIAREQHDVFSYWADGGSMDYYFIGGQNLMEVIQHFSLIGGRAEMPPMWALGFHQSKWSYFPDSRVQLIAQRFRNEKIPCDVIYLDIDYMDGFRCFTWDKGHFPEPKRMVEDLKKKGFQTVAIIDPGIKIDHDYAVFVSGIEEDVFCKRQDGDFVKGKVWPGQCYFPDFTNPKVRKWWARQFREMIKEVKLSGIWVDMNEPAIFEVASKTLPLDARHDYEGNQCSHRKAHNVYGLTMAMASLEGFKRFNQGNRPFIMARSGYTGMQRFASTWTGDNLANWEHLNFAHQQCIRLSLCGMSFCGSDIGGFIGQPTEELYLRWLQLGVFHPLFRVHSSGDHGDQEPWSFSKETLKYSKAVIEMRYRLLPYIYTTYYQYHQEGRPFLRALVLSENSIQYANNSEECFCGDHLLFSPVFEPGVRNKIVQLPNGEWYDYHSEEKLEGDKTYTYKLSREYIPCFVRSGSIIPHFPVMQYVGEKNIEEVRLKVFIGLGKQKSYFYWDQMDGFAYLNGEYRYTEFLTQGFQNTFFIQQKFQPGFQPDFKDYRIELIGIQNGELHIEIDGQLLNSYQLSNKKNIEFKVHRDFESINIQY